MAKRNRYREMESKMTLVLISAAVFFVLYLVCASFGLNVLKYILAIVSIVASALCLVWLYLTGEFTRRRSLWMVTGFICIIACLLVSMILKYPYPAA
ncbi:MAG: hypothetical protein IJA75_04220 [Oscillospiraceae bacterium]|nr:hypothetical protein [Oscillospiraceae bacterium]